MSKSIADVLALIQENNVEMVNFKMADAKGEYHQITIPASTFSIEFIQKGININTANYSCVAANKCDAIFIPDLDSANIDNGSIIPTVVISGELRYFSKNASEIALEVENGKVKKGKASRVFGTVSLLCGLAGLILLVLEIVIGFCTWLCSLLPYVGGQLVAFLGIPAAVLILAIIVVVLVLGIIGIVFGSISIGKSKKAGRSAGLGIAGLVLSILAMVLWLLPLIVFTIVALVCLSIIILIIGYFLLIIIVYVLYVVLAGCVYNL